MKIKKVVLNTSDAYTSFVRAFATLLDAELTKWEELAKDKSNYYRLAHIMPALISLVNTAGYLRGQDNMFLDYRPHTDAQKEFYAYENNFEKRLYKLIDLLMASDSKAIYIERLEEYFIEVRADKHRMLL